MKIEFYNSTAGGAFWSKTLGAIAKKGCHVKHRWVIDLRAYRFENTNWDRFQKVWKMYPWYCVKSLFGPPADVHVVTTNPFCNPVLVCWRYGRKNKTINLLYDLFPDALELAGLIKRGGFVSRVIAVGTRFAVRRSSATVFLGEHLRRYVEQRYGYVNNANVIPVGADGSAFVGCEPDVIADGEIVQLMYCGNMGRAHDTDTLLKYIKSDYTGEFALRFNAKGKGYEKLKHDLRGFTNPHLCLSDPLPGDAWVDAMKTAHVGVITMKSGWENVVMPSKAYSAMVAGQAILAICPEKSDLADLIRLHNCGWIVEPEDIVGLSKTLKKIVEDRELLHEKRMNAYTAGHRVYDSRIVAKQWVALFEDLIKEK